MSNKIGDLDKNSSIKKNEFNSKYKRIETELKNISKSIKGKKGKRFLNRNKNRLEEARRNYLSKHRKEYLSDYNKILYKSGKAVEKVNKRAKGFKTGAKVLGTGIGLGTYYLLNKMRNKKDDNN